MPSKPKRTSPTSSQMGSSRETFSSASEAEVASSSSTSPGQHSSSYVQLRPSNHRLKGRILEQLINELQTTQQLAYLVRENLSCVRDQLVRLHHLGIIVPVGLRYDTDSEPPSGLELSYFDDLLWDLTLHTRDHHESVEGCYGCAIREALPGSETIGFSE